MIQFPDVKQAHDLLASTWLSLAEERNLNKTGRSIFAIAGQRTFLIAALGSFVSWSALGMFIPSFFTGTLCNWLGPRLVMLTGFLTQLMRTLLFQRRLNLPILIWV
jgi:hypothetical protein